MLMKPEVIITEQNLPEDVLRAIKQGKKIEAIKLLREETGLGLANAKVLVDRASSKFAPKSPNPAITHVPSGAISLLKMVLAVAVFIAVYRYFSAG